MNNFPFGTNAVLVTRVSTDVQSTDAQLHELEAWATEHGYTNLVSFKTTESGFLKYDHKTGWNLVTDFFESHPDYRVLICTEISRLGRRKVILDMIQEYLVENKIQLIIKDLSFQLLRDDGTIDIGKDLVFSLSSSLAQSEMHQKRERFHRARIEYGKQGLCIGGKELFGYVRLKTEEKINGKQRSIYVINEKEASEIKQIYQWYAYGLDGNPQTTSIRTITLRCIREGMSTYLHSKRNVNKALKEQAYTGQKTTHNRMKNPDFWNYKDSDAPRYKDAISYSYSYPPIFSTVEERELFDAVQRRMRDNSSKLVATNDIFVDKSRKHTTILSKLLICPSCMKPLVGEYRSVKGRRQYIYRCHNSRATINKCGFGHSDSMMILDGVVYAVSKGAILSLKSNDVISDITLKIQELEKQKLNLEKKDSSIEEEKRRLYKNYTDMLLKHPENAEHIDEAFEISLKRLSGNEYEKEIKILSIDIATLREKAIKYNSLTAPSDELLVTKKDYYQYIHAVVDSISYIFTSRERTILHINFARELRDACGNVIRRRVSEFIRNDGFVCIYKNTRGHSDALFLTYELDNSEDSSVGPKWDIKDKITWNNEKKLFETPEGDWTLDELHERVFPSRKPQFSDVFKPMRDCFYVKMLPIEYQFLDVYGEDERKDLQ